MVTAAPVSVQTDVPARMRDGVILRADVYRPTGTGPYPELLTRSPCVKAALPMTVETNRALAARRARNPGTVMLAFGGALAASLALLAIAPRFKVALVVGAMIGASSSGFHMLSDVNLMERTDPAYLGRAMAVSMMALGFNSVLSYPTGLSVGKAAERATVAGLACTCLAVVGAGSIALWTTPKRPPVVSACREPAV